ncbi:hypothetical protein OG474_08035 [Kribbella sp. NBC_01505]|uniref:hypothetical protein n=1 Tax=Kribbella sp. NBC_01505 TaxID=2903580 RepID=UPI00386E0A75
MITTFVVLAVLAVGCGLLWLHSRAERRRIFARRLAAAAKVGLEPAPVEPWLVETAARSFGARGEAEHLVAGPHGVQETLVRAFDYTYDTTSTATAAKCHVITYELPVALPPIAVLRKNPLLPGQEFESEQFNKQFSVDCADSRYASAIINPQLMLWLVDDYRSLQWRIEGRLLIAWGVGYWTYPGLADVLYAFDGIVQRIPPFVLTDYGKPTTD